MRCHSIRFDLLFDASEHWRSGRCPWTFFAYPTSLADDLGLPPDDAACRLLATLQNHGIDVAIWSNGPIENTTYFACRQEDLQRLDHVLQELGSGGVMETGFLGKLSSRLFASLDEGDELHSFAAPPD